MTLLVTLKVKTVKLSFLKSKQKGWGCLRNFMFQKLPNHNTYCIFEYI
jgi:hypothetical protein